MERRSSGDHTAWEPTGIGPALAEHCTVYAVDRRGHGESGDATTYALEREVEDVTAVVESIDEPVILFGHSFAALCALEAALRTDNLRGLILYEPAFAPGDGYTILDDWLAASQSLVDDGETEQAIVTFWRNAGTETRLPRRVV